MRRLFENQNIKRGGLRAIGFGFGDLSKMH